MEEKVHLIETEVSAMRESLARLEKQLREEWQADIGGAVDASHNCHNGCNV